MLINNAIVFNSLVGTGAPEIIYTLYNPVQHWARQELETCGPGSIVIQLTGTCPGGCELGTVWVKRSRTHGNGENDYIAMTTQAFSGTTDPVASNADLCAAPLGSYYVKRSNANEILQVYVKINNTCSISAVIHDWHPLMLQVTRTGDEFSFDSASYTLNLPPTGNLSYDEDDNRFVWTPDDGSDTLTIPVPILTDNEDGTYTYDPNDGVSSPVTITATVPSIPADISAVKRPWVKVGTADATNASNVQNSDAIYHTGTMVRGAVSIGSGNANAELRGNNALGAGNHTMTSATNSSVLSGDTNKVLSSANAAVISGANNQLSAAPRSAALGDTNQITSSANGFALGQDNVINGSADAATNINDFVGGQANSITNTKNAAIVAGYNNSLVGAHSSFLGAGDGNEISANGAAVLVGGTTNKVLANRGQILGGMFNEAGGVCSTALGMKAQVQSGHHYAVLINCMPGGDPNSDSDPFNSAAATEFAVRCGGIRLYTNLAESAGMTMAAGASSWSAVSDERTKQDITLQEGDALGGYRVLRVVSYVQGELNVGAGVTAQNFYMAFPFVPVKQIGDMLAINQMDRDGVQDRAIQQLLNLVESLAFRVAELEQRLAA